MSGSYLLKGEGVVACSVCALVSVSRFHTGFRTYYLYNGEERWDDNMEDIVIILDNVSSKV